MELTRRGFIAGALAGTAVAGGPQFVAAAAGDAQNRVPPSRDPNLGRVVMFWHDKPGNFYAPKRVAPNLRFGVLSDIHIGGKKDAAERTERTLRWLASKDVDAVLCPGDIAHSGLIGELEAFAEVWHRVFPANGKKVELMISTGNHDVDAWGGRWNNFTEERMLAERFNYKDNPQKTWRRLFGQEWEPIWRREVKGYVFIGSQWSSLKPPIERYFRDHAAELSGGKPFFYCQHEHPKGTCHGSYSMGDDRGESVRALSAFPNAVAFTGHSHCAISDERTVWQGAFTSIGAGCIHEGAGGFNYDNVNASWHPGYRKKLMASMADPNSWGGDAKGGGCELVEVFDGYIVVHRHSIDFDRQIGPAWTVPVPASAGGPFDFERRAARRSAPQFDAHAKISATFCPDGHPLEGVGHIGEPCIYVTFPRAGTVDGCRVFDYTVEAVAADAQEDARPLAVRKLVAAGFAYPEEDANIPGECLFAASELPTDRPMRFKVTPRDCFGRAGRPLFHSTTLRTSSAAS